MTSSPKQYVLHDFMLKNSMSMIVRSTLLTLVKNRVSILAHGESVASGHGMHLGVVCVVIEEWVPCPDTPVIQHTIINFRSFLCIYYLFRSVTHSTLYLWFRIETYQFIVSL
jgi:hypothetical protein